MERMQIPGITNEVAFTDFYKGLRQRSDFMFDIVRKQLFTLPEALAEAERVI